MIVSFREPTLIEILSDPITQAVMEADAVDPKQLERMLREIETLRRASNDASDTVIIAPALVDQETASAQPVLWQLNDS
jgi:hypothetical protein